MTELISKKRKRDNKIKELVENIKIIQEKGEFSIGELGSLFGENYQYISGILRKGIEFKISYERANFINERALEIINKI